MFNKSTLLALMSAIIGTSAAAEPVKLSFSGKTDPYTFSNPFPPSPAGNTFEGYFIFNNKAPVVSTTTTSTAVTSTFKAITEFYFKSAGYEFGLDLSLPYIYSNDIVITNAIDPSGKDLLRFNMMNLTFYGSIELEGDFSTFDAATLPESINVSSFTSRNVFQAFNVPGYYFRGSLDSAAVTAVPEPTSWAMMMLGIGSVGAAMRRRSKVSTTVKFA